MQSLYHIYKHTSKKYCKQEHFSRTRYRCVIWGNIEYGRVDTRVILHLYRVWWGSCFSVRLSSHFHLTYSHLTYHYTFHHWPNCNLRNPLHDNNTSSLSKFWECIIKINLYNPQWIYIKIIDVPSLTVEYNSRVIYVIHLFWVCSWPFTSQWFPLVCFLSHNPCPSFYVLFCFMYNSRVHPKRETNLNGSAT